MSNLFDDVAQMCEGIDNVQFMLIREPEGVARVKVRGTATRDGKANWAWMETACIDEREVVRYTVRSMLDEAARFGVTVKGVLVMMPSERKGPQ